MSKIAPEHELIVAQSQEEIEQCYQIRIDVFHHEQRFPLETEIDEYDIAHLCKMPFTSDTHTAHSLDPTAIHLLLRLKDELLTPIGTIRVSIIKDYYKLSRLAVLKDYRQFKFGRKLVEGLHDWVKSHALTVQPGRATASIVLHSQIYVKAFYAKYVFSHK